MTIHQPSRRNVLNLAGAAGAGLAGCGWLGAAAAAEAEGADLVVFNARVYTVDPKAPKAQAFAVKDGRFVAVGTDARAKAMIGRRTQVYDAKGMTVVPGFIDCHNHAPGHAPGTNLLYDVLVGNPYEVEFVTIDSIVGKLRDKAQKTPPGYWVEGYFFDDTKVKEGRELNVHDLDKVSTEHPVAVYHRGGHTAYYNTKAMEMAGVTRDIKDTAAGTYDRFPDGSLNGRVTDRARNVFAKVGRRETFTPEQTLQRDRDGLAFISKQFVRYGLTSVCHEGGDLFALQQVRARGDLKHRVSYEANGAVLEAMIASGWETGFGDEWIRLGATSEHAVDGSFSERTMALSTPYPGMSPPYQGNLTETQEDLDGWIERAHRAGIQVNCHANGDVAIERVLNSVERAQRLFPRADARPKITHCTLVNDALVRRIKAAGVTPALFTSYAYYNADKFHFYGEAMMEHMMPYRSLLDAGVPACAGSDFSPGPFAPLMGMQGMVTRKGWNGETWGANQRITVTESLQVNTINGAYNTHEEALKGSISAGKLADFLVLADDPHTVDPNKIKDIRIVRTVVGGGVSYEA